MRRRRPLLLAATVLAVVAGACGEATEVTVTPVVDQLGGAVPVEPTPTTGAEEAPPQTVVSVVVEPAVRITFWSTETAPDQLDALEAIIDGFTAATGIAVDVTAVGSDQLPALMATNAASGTLPDVVLHPAELGPGWAAQGLLDAVAAQAVVDRLGAGTFSPRALELLTVGESATAVPSDGWGLVLVYRMDLFEAADLEAPATFADVAAAAAELHDPRNDFFGIAAATADDETLTHQTFEHLALANGCRLTDGAGEVALASDECGATLEFFTDLVDRYGPPGAQDSAGARRAYLAGEAGMVMWPTRILDELAGLDASVLPTCEECEDDPAFLAGVSGIVPALRGPDGAPAQYGQISSLGIGNTGDDETTAAAQQFVEFWLTDGYLDWLAASPEGKLPLRRGTEESPTAYSDGWKALPIGGAGPAALADAYPAAVLDALLDGTASFDRWGPAEGAAELMASLAVPGAVARVLDGDDVDDVIDDLVAVVEAGRERAGEE